MSKTHLRRVIWMATLLLLPILWLRPPQVEAQHPPDSPPPPPLRFEQLSLADGLSQNSVLAIRQDSLGFMWFGTQDGLNRYDGYSFTVFRHEPENPNSLSHNAILAIVEDSTGMLWLGAWGGGLNRYDPATGQFSRYRHDPADPASLSHDLVAAIHEDSRGNLWLGTLGGGLDRLNRETGQFEHFRHDPADPASLSSDDVSVIFEDAAGALWIGTGGFSVEGTGLNRFDPETGRVTRYQHDPADPNTLSSNTIAAIQQDRTGALWIGAGGFGLAGNGLNRLDPQTGEITRYRHDPADPAGLSSNDVMSLYLDSNNSLWVGTWDGGLNQANLADPSPQFRPLSDDIVWSMAEDRSGVLWLGTVNGGLNKLNPQVRQFRQYSHDPDDPHSLAFDVVGVFYEDRQGGFWVGTLGGGLDYFDRATGRFSHYPHDPADPASLSDNNVTALYEDGTGALWVGTIAGLNRLERATGQFRRYYHDPDDPNSLAHDNVWGIAGAGEDRLWLATMAGLDLFDPATGRFTHYQHDPADPASLGANELVSLYQDRGGVLWLGSWGGGLSRLEPGQYPAEPARFVNYRHDPADPASLSDDNVWSIYEDRAGALWVGTEGGLNRFDREQETFTRYRAQDGLPADFVVGIVEDGQGYLWLSTTNGLARFDPQAESFRTYDIHDGLQSNEFNAHAAYRTQNGELYFGGIQGFNLFWPEEIEDNAVPPPVVVTSFSVFNQPRPVDLSGSTPVELSYRENFIAFEFAALDFRAPRQNQYAYILEGIDPDWVEAGSRRYASYTNLPGGQYLFRVRGSNSDGLWSEIARPIPLAITPPFWQSWWFRLGLALLVVLAGVGLYSWRVVSIQAQNRALEQEVGQRTAELADTNRRLLAEIEQRRRAEEALARKAADEAVAAERTRLARDLHDAVTQTLFSASLTAEVLPDLWAVDPAEARHSTEELRQLTRGALAEMRALLLELRPSALSEAPLEDLLRQLTEAIVGRARLPVEFAVQGQRQLPVEVKVAFYRIAQEALNNVVKYARADQVRLDLRLQAESARLVISDDGVGFDPVAVGPTHLGLKIMRERAEAIQARLGIHSEAGQGTLITLTWHDPESEAE